MGLSSRPILSKPVAPLPQTHSFGFFSTSNISASLLPGSTLWQYSHLWNERGAITLLSANNNSDYITCTRNGFVAHNIRYYTLSFLISKDPWLLERLFQNNQDKQYRSNFPSPLWKSDDDLVFYIISTISHMEMMIMKDLAIKCCKVWFIGL